MTDHRNGVGLIQIAAAPYPDRAGRLRRRRGLALFMGLFIPVICLLGFSELVAGAPLTRL